MFCLHGTLFFFFSFLKDVKDEREGNQGLIAGHSCSYIVVSCVINFFVFKKKQYANLETKLKGSRVEQEANGRGGG